MLDEAMTTSGEQGRANRMGAIRLADGIQFSRSVIAGQLTGVQ